MDHASLGSVLCPSLKYPLSIRMTNDRAALQLSALIGSGVFSRSEAALENRDGRVLGPKAVGYNTCSFSYVAGSYSERMAGFGHGSMGTRRSGSIFSSSIGEMNMNFNVGYGML